MASSLHEDLIAGLCVRPGVRKSGFHAAFRHYFGYDDICRREWELPKVLPDAWRIFVGTDHPTMVVWEVHTSHINEHKWLPYLEFCDAFGYGIVEIHVDRHGAESIGLYEEEDSFLTKVTTSDAIERRQLRVDKLMEACAA